MTSVHRANTRLGLWASHFVIVCVACSLFPSGSLLVFALILVLPGIFILSQAGLEIITMLPGLPSAGIIGVCRHGAFHVKFCQGLLFIDL